MVWSRNFQGGVILKAGHLLQQGLKTKELGLKGLWLVVEYCVPLFFQINTLLELNNNFLRGETV